MDALYRWPPATAVGKTVPKDDIYRAAKATGAVREKFVAQVARITWAYKLAEHTVNLPGSATIPEIQVFAIEARGSDVQVPVLAAIDKAVQTPIIFEITASDGLFACTRVAASAAVGTRTGGGYLSSPWISVDAPRAPLPTAISLPALYAAILQQLAGVAADPGATPADVSQRLAAIRGLEREVAALTKKMHAERQFNRKTELHRQVRAMQAELAALGVRDEAGVVP